ncbi:MAG: hypothetical protein AUK32_01975 [Candidatus Aquicultor secundus]|nr:DUF4446 family protein [Candidatus Aquicultor secundus]NCO65098.1 DUF4446 family protein [Solirubrobacter sp.]OIO88229.1 MAG: hypothetical protein AUK32_01975 [Candidatus Aquicultor secundus]
MDIRNGSLILALVAAGWLVLALWLLVVSLNLKKINRRSKAIVKAGEHGDFAGAVESSLNQLSLLNSAINEVKADQAHLADTLSSAVQRVGVVRFDAFDDIGGRLSFAVALLDNNGNGAVLSTINGRQESRSYAKAIRNNTSEFTLSAEEHQAIREAFSNTATKTLV